MQDNAANDFNWGAGSPSPKVPAYKLLPSLDAQPVCIEQDVLYCFPPAQGQEPLLRCKNYPLYAGFWLDKSPVS